jgi:hypothetical protein
MDTPAAHISLTADELRAVVAVAVREEVSLAFERVGLHDRDAGRDIRDARAFISGWRVVSRRVGMWLLGLLLGVVSYVLWPHLRAWFGS